MAQYIGGWGTCCCAAGVTFCVQDCNGNPIVGAVVSAFLSGVLQASCTTTAGGCCTMASLTSGTYNIQVTVGGLQVYNNNLTVTAGHTYTLVVQCCIQICVKDCGGTSDPYRCGATVTVKNATSGATLGTGTTDTTTGCVIIMTTPTALLPFIGGVQEATIQVNPNSVLYNNYSATQAVPCSLLSPPVVILLTTAITPSTCCANSVHGSAPVKDNGITLSDANGNHALCAGPNWSICYGIASIGGVINSLCSATVTAGIAVNYAISCDTDPVNGKACLHVQRQWSSGTLSGGGAGYMPTTCVAGNCSNIMEPGFQCLPQQIDLADGYFDLDLCNALSVSGSLTPAAGNLMPDPVGGTVTLS